MAAAGHEFFAPTYTGLGERVHLVSPENDLETHIQDVVDVLKFEDLRNVVLIGHSYGGMVATGVADRAPGALMELLQRILSICDLSPAAADTAYRGVRNGH
jgi:pimeloyl-ACP methyl ester carboxylesterase